MIHFVILLILLDVNRKFTAQRWCIFSKDTIFLNVTFGCNKKTLPLPRFLKNDPLAQQVEHIPFKDGALGSNPRRITLAAICIIAAFFMINDLHFLIAAINWQSPLLWRSSLL